MTEHEEQQEHEPTSEAIIAWRCFPWHAEAEDNSPFSPSYIPPGQRTGRFDLADQPLILYLSDDPAHVVAEALQAFRNLPFLPGMLRKHGYQLAITKVTVRAVIARRLANLCDPAALTQLGIAPDTTAHHDRAVTQPLMRQIYDATAMYAGVRWWSTLTGAWHTVALFADRFGPEDVTFETPRSLTFADSEVVAARQMLNLR